jgi:hypothetical protein
MSHAADSVIEIYQAHRWVACRRADLALIQSLPIHFANLPYVFLEH